MANTKKTSKSKPNKSRHHGLLNLNIDDATRNTGLILLSGLLIIGLLQIPIIKQFINSRTNANAFMSIKTGGIQQDPLNNTYNLMGVTNEAEQFSEEPPVEEPPDDPTRYCCKSSNLYRLQ